nr:hypothetical protein [Tanacetum cinerariifolium]
MEEYIRLATKKALRKGKVYNWKTATYGKIRYDEDVHFLRSVETKFQAIVYNDALTSKLELSCEPTISPQHIDKVNWKIEMSLSDSDDENYTDQIVLNFQKISQKPDNINTRMEIKRKAGSESSFI